MTMKMAGEKSIYRGVQILGNGSVVSHLFYADDALFLCGCSRLNLKNHVWILKCFHASSGLKVKFHNYKVFEIGASSTETAQPASILGCVASSLSFLYTGVPVGANMNLVKDW